MILHKGNDKLTLKDSYGMMMGETSYTTKILRGIISSDGYCQKDNKAELLIQISMTLCKKNIKTNK